MSMEEMHSPGDSGELSDAELDAILAAAEDRLLTAIHCSLDLEAGLAQIIGDPPRREPSPALPADALSTPDSGKDLEADAARCTEPPTPAAQLRIRFPGPEHHCLMASARSASRRRLTKLERQRVHAAKDVEQDLDDLARAEDLREWRAHRRTSGYTGALRLLALTMTLADAVVAYVAIGVFVTNHVLTATLAVLTALTGATIACILARCRRRRLSVLITARILEGIFVGALTMLRYEGLRVQGTSPLTATGAAALTALIVLAGLVITEEAIVTTRTFGDFLGALLVIRKRRNYLVAARRLARIQAGDAAASQLQGYFSELPAKAEGLPQGAAQPRSAAIPKSTQGGNVPALAKPTSRADRLVTGPNLGSRRRAKIALGSVTAVAVGVLAAGLLASDPQQPAPQAGPPLAYSPPVAAQLQTTALVFPIGQARLSNTDEAALKWLAGLLKSAGAASATIEGFASATGTIERNQKLSLARAQDVADFLVVHGVPASRLVIIGSGGLDQDGLTALAQAVNRNVVVILISDGKLGRPIDGGGPWTTSSGP